MTGEILHDILKSINYNLKAKGRTVLFMDNAGCHPSDLAEHYSNIKVMFLQPNTTSKLQPLDLGIIMNFKVYYRKFLMRFILGKIEERTTATDVKSVTILHAIRWVSQAWKEVRSEVIKKCFRKAGILNGSFHVVSRDVPAVDPFLDLDDDDEDHVYVDEEMQDLITQLQIENPCSAEELALADEDVPVCSDLDDDNWKQTLLSEICAPISKSARTKDTGEQTNEESDEEVVDELPPPPVFKSYTEAIACLEDVHHFLEHKGHTGEATSYIIDEYTV